jgi:hypothetical protein
MRKILAVLALSLLASVSYAQDSNTFWPPLPGSTMNGPLLLPQGTSGAPAIAPSAWPTTGIYFQGQFGAGYFSSVGNIVASWGPTGFGVGQGFAVGWGGDTFLYRDAAATLGLRNGGTSGTPVPQAFKIYNFCDGASCATGYQRASMEYVGNVFKIDVEWAGTGTDHYFAYTFNGSGGYAFTQTNFNPGNDVSDLGQVGAFWKTLNLARSIQGSKSKALTDAGAAVSIWRVAVPTNGYAGGDVIFTANSTDGTNRLTTTGRVTFAGADTGGTVTCGIGAPYALATAYRRANTLVCTFTAVTSTTNCDIQVTCTDNLAAAQTMAIESRLDMPTPNTITPQ